MYTPLKPFVLLFATLALLLIPTLLISHPGSTSSTGSMLESSARIGEGQKNFLDGLNPLKADRRIPAEEPDRSSSPGAFPTFSSQKPAKPTMTYTTRPGDTLTSLSGRFGVPADQIISDPRIDPRGLLPAGKVLSIPTPSYSEMTPPDLLLPDSEVVFSISADNFDTQAYVLATDGLLSRYEAFVPYYKDADGWEIIQHVATTYSINPRLLLSLLEYHSQWLTEDPDSPNQELYPLGYHDGNYEYLHRQLIFTAQQLSIGYYGWREGVLTDLTFEDGSQVRLHPALNAGTAAVMYFYAQVYDRLDWESAVDPNSGLIHLHSSMFGDPWVRAVQYPSIFPNGPLLQPEMVLPFENDDLWFYASGPHGAWVDTGAQAAIDFTPSSEKLRCVTADNWVVAPVSGLVTRLSSGLLVLDLDMDGSEQTGWVLMILHLDIEGSIQKGDLVSQYQRIGHASCLGGRATDSHIHLARKYNGEWIHAGGPIPFVLGGWEVVSGDSSYEGFLTDGTTILRASITGTVDTQIRCEDAVSTNP